MKTIHLCADDFGLNEGVSTGILTLVENRRLSAVSCMVNLPDFAVYAPQLALFRQHIQIGLHFNLTEKKAFTLPELLIKSHLKCLPLSLIAQEFQAQLDEFIETMGFFPHFIDGHQHVHQLPGIRTLLLEKASEMRRHSCWVRATYPSQSHSLKAAVLALTGGRCFQKELAKNKIASNSSFEGIYHFNSKKAYRTYFRRWLSHAKDGTLIMCHPGYTSPGGDAIACTRPLELAYLLSPHFEEDCAEYHCKLYYS